MKFYLFIPFPLANMMRVSSTPIDCRVFFMSPSGRLTPWFCSALSKKLIEKVAQLCAYSNWPAEDALACWWMNAWSLRRRMKYWTNWLKKVIEICLKVLSLRNSLFGSWLKCLWPASNCLKTRLIFKIWHANLLDSSQIVKTNTSIHAATRCSVHTWHIFRISEDLNRKRELKKLATYRGSTIRTFVGHYSSKLE
jgi:hypothetical protein